MRHFIIEGLCEPPFGPERPVGLKAGEEGVGGGFIHQWNAASVFAVSMS